MEVSERARTWLESLDRVDESIAGYHILSLIGTYSESNSKPRKVL